MKQTINQEEQQQIQEAIKAFEKRSSAEIVTIIAKQSDSYLFITTLYAAIGALLLPLIPCTILGKMTLQQLSALELMTFILLAFFAQLEPVKMLLVPSFIKKKRCANAAKRHFMELEVHATKSRASLMLFVSEAEKYVEIITDVAIAKRVDNARWQEIIDNFIILVQEEKVAEGYLQSIDKIGEILISEFPYDKDEEDELPNHMIFVE
jgi:putative membrane protein